MGVAVRGRPKTDAGLIPAHAHRIYASSESLGSITLHDLGTKWATEERPQIATGLLRGSAVETETISY